MELVCGEGGNGFDKCACWLDEGQDVLVGQAVGVIVVTGLSDGKEPMVETSEFGGEDARLDVALPEEVDDAAVGLRHVAAGNEQRGDSVVGGVVETVRGGVPILELDNALGLGVSAAGFFEARLDNGAVLVIRQAHSATPSLSTFL